MNNSSSGQSVSPEAISSNLTNAHKNKGSIDDVITIKEKVNLTKQQHSGPNLRGNDIS